MIDDLPSWIKVGRYNRKEYLKTKGLVTDNNLNTVCLEANCPNRYECFSKKTATFMILGDTCTRNCLYCNVKKGLPEKVDEDEPGRIADAVKRLGLNYAVITCVTRDDLKDGGAEHFVRTLNSIRGMNPGCKVELLISDLDGKWDSLRKIIGSKPDVLNHNIEVAREIFTGLRPKGGYDISIGLLKRTKELDPVMKTKSGLMVGLGENETQVIQTIKDLKGAGCDMITIGQYLQPNEDCVQVNRYYTPEDFEGFRSYGESLGIKVLAGPLVRSSYKAGEL